MKTHVVNVSKSSYDVYIGRLADYGDTCWGNPFKIGKDGDRDEVIRKYEEWILTQPQLMSKLHTLRGKVLGCHCKPMRCHGEVLARLANMDINLLEW